MQPDSEYDLNFYIVQFRRMFARIIFIYILITIALLYIMYQLSQIQEPVYYAASESGLLRKLEPYNKNEISQFLRVLKNKSNQQP